jgi:hypothetical protein
MPTLPPCPVPCVVTPWSDWSACGGTCAPALRQRVRNIVSREMFGGMTCPEVQALGSVFFGAAVVHGRDFATVYHHDALHPADSATNAFPAPTIADPDAHAACRS